jgi:Zn finger protein HypA/HybF involved in hydrogenase expression
MIDAINGMINGLKTAAEIVQGLLTLKIDSAVSAKATELNGVISDLRHKLFTIQTDHSTVLSRINALEAEIVRLKNWDEEKKNYELNELARDSFAYRVKPSMQGAEPPHNICPECYQQNVKSILQKHVSSGGARAFICPHCSTIVYQ